jgi:hypothetical protein
MILAAGERGWIDADAAMREALTSMRRAGADMIISYYAREMAGGDRGCGSPAVKVLVTRGGGDAGAGAGAGAASGGHQVVALPAALDVTRS